MPLSVFVARSVRAARAFAETVRYEIEWFREARAYLRELRELPGKSNAEIDAELEH